MCLHHAHRTWLPLWFKEKNSNFLSNLKEIKQNIKQKNERDSKLIKKKLTIIDQCQKKSDSVIYDLDSVACTVILSENLWMLLPVVEMSDDWTERVEACRD